MFSCVYLDYAGAPLVHPDLVDAIGEDLKKLFFGNPHSRNTTSQTTTDLVDQCRFRLLKYFSTTSEEYSVIFTSSCTAALKLVGECFDWTKCSSCSMKEIQLKLQDNFSVPPNFDARHGPSFMYLQDNHTSVVGMREYALANHAQVYCVTDEQLSDILQQGKMTSGAENCTCNKLFAFPAQSNFCGRKYPLKWIDQIKNSGGNKRCFVCLDAASLVANSALNLSTYKPDFVTLSFYKIFGCPTGLGALLVKNDSAHILHRRYFGGGTLTAYLPGRNVHKNRSNLSEKFEDGTIPFQQILALKHGFQMLEKQGGIPVISEKTFSLAKFTHFCLQQMRHSNGKQVAINYCSDNFNDNKTQGPIVNFNLVRSDGTYVGYTEIEKMAELYNVQLRTGCFCNQGACQKYLGLSDEQLLGNIEAGKECGDVMDMMDGHPLGSVRVSFGFMSTLNDVKHFLKMIFDCFVEKEPDVNNFDLFWKKFSSVSFDQQTINSSISRQNVLEKFIVPSTFSNHTIRLTDIILYPLKSCGGIFSESWPLSDTGLLYDRHWMITNEDGLCLNQKREPKLVLIKPTLTNNFQILHLSFENFNNFSLPINSNEAEIQSDNFLTTNPVCQTKVCADKVTTCDAGDEVSDWICSALNRPYCRLVSQIESVPRVGKRGKNDSNKSFVSLANQEQYLLVSRASIKKLLHLVQSTMPEITENNLISRFRPNLVVDGSLPFEEDTWKSVIIGNKKFSCVGKCTRCQMICINQDTGEFEPSILVSLRNIKENKITFGIYLRADDDYEGDNVAVGDSVIVQI